PTTTTSEFMRYATDRAVPSFPTRRSSDLTHPPDGLHEMHDQEQTDGVTAEADEPLEAGGYVGGADNGNDRPSHKHHHGGEDVGRSEEHTSELQSRENLVCRLLLEKKKHS